MIDCLDVEKIHLSREQFFTNSRFDLVFSMMFNKILSSNQGSMKWWIKTRDA